MIPGMEFLDPSGTRRVVDDAVIVVSELATNAYLHASTPFDVEIDLRDDLARIVVVDSDRIYLCRWLRHKTPAVAGV